MVDCVDIGWPFGECGQGTCETGGNRTAEIDRDAGPYHCQCELGWRKSAFQRSDGEQLCIIPELVAQVLNATTASLSILALMFVIPNAVISLTKLKRATTDNRPTILQAVFRRFGLLGYVIGTLVSSIASLGNWSLHEFTTIFCVAASSGTSCFMLVVWSQVEKYFQFVFKEQARNYIFNPVRVVIIIVTFSSVGLFVYASVLPSQSEARVYAKSGIRLYCMHYGVWGYTVIFLSHRCFSHLRQNLAVGIGKKERTQRRKVLALIKRNIKLEVATFCPVFLASTLCILIAMNPLFYRLFELLISSALCACLLGMLILQLDFVQRMYLRHVKKLARQLKRMERQGIILKIKWSKLKAYATQSSVAPISSAVAPAKPIVIKEAGEISEGKWETVYDT